MIQKIKTHKRIWIISAIVLLLIYLSGPIIAATFEIGDRWGPKIYPIWLHEFMYSMTWCFTDHDLNKPRIGMWFKEKYRPWFYGLKSKNYDPEYADPEINRILKEGGLPPIETLRESRQ